MRNSDLPVPQHQQQRNVHAWMRAAAYAAGTDPEEAFAVAPMSGFEAAEFDVSSESTQQDFLALGDALLGIGLIA